MYLCSLSMALWSTQDVRGERQTCIMEIWGAQKWSILGSSIWWFPGSDPQNGPKWDILKTLNIQDGSGWDLCSSVFTCVLCLWPFGWYNHLSEDPSYLPDLSQSAQIWWYLGPQLARLRPQIWPHFGPLWSGSGEPWIISSTVEADYRSILPPLGL